MHVNICILVITNMIGIKVKNDIPYVKQPLSCSDSILSSIFFLHNFFFQNWGGPLSEGRPGMKINKLILCDLINTCIRII